MKNKLKEKIQKEKLKEQKLKEQKLKEEKIKEEKKNENNNKIPQKEIEQKKKEREINDYYKTSQILDKFPNTNLFKNDVKYTINKFLDFKFKIDNLEFRDLILSLFYENQVSIVIILYFRFFIFNISNLLNGKNFFHKNIYIHLFSIFISLFLMLSKSKFKNEFSRILVKLILDINHSIYLSLIYQIDEISFIEEFFYSGIGNIMLNLRINVIIASNTHLVIAFYIILSKKYNNLILNIIIQSIGSIIFVYLCKRGIRYLWILFDSFKRSFLVFNSMIENCSGPIFILSQNMDILYANKAAKKFDEYIHKSKNNSDIKKKIGFKMETNFKKMIIPNLYPLFTKFLEDTINNKTIKNFFFPFISIYENLDIYYKRYSNYFLILGDFPKLNWYNIICSKCIWKFDNCIFLNIIPCYTYYKNEILLNQIKLFLEKLEEYNENANKMCEIILRCERNSLISTSASNKSLRRLGIYMKNSKARRESVLSYGNDIGLVFPNMDYSILFFFKNQSEVLYDLLNTQNLYFNLFSPRKILDFNINKQLVNLEIFTNYLTFYFDALLTSKYCTIDFKMKENCKFIFIEENILRITLFNVFLFILSNTSSNDNKKNIICSVRLLKEKKNYQNKKNAVESSPIDFLKKKRISNKKSRSNYTLFFDICITGDSSLDYNRINYLLKNKNLNGNYFFNEISKHNYLNIGIITAYQIVTKLFKNEFSLNSSEKGNTILFGLTCEKESKYYNDYNDFNENEGISKCFCEENFYFYNFYYHEKLIKNIYNIEDNEVNNFNRLFLKLEKCENNSGGKSSDYDSENDIRFNSQNNNKINNNNNNNDFIINNSNIINGKINNFKRKIIHLKNKSINKVKSELRNIDQDIFNRNNQFTSFGIDNLKNE